MLPGVGVVEGGLLHSVPHLRHLPDGPDDGHRLVLGYRDVSGISQVTERLPERLMNDHKKKLDLAFNNVKPKDWYFIFD